MLQVRGELRVLEPKGNPCDEDSLIAVGGPQRPTLRVGRGEIGGLYRVQVRNFTARIARALGYFKMHAIISATG
jgi:hypothetical protein